MTALDGVQPYLYCIFWIWNCNSFRVVLWNYLCNWVLLFYQIKVFCL